MAISRQNETLHIENVALDAVAERFGTPCYVYSRRALENSLQEFQQVLQGKNALVCYAVKANSNLAILNLMARMGAGFDIVSGGELQRVIAAGGDPGKVIFSGVGKTRAELQLALELGIGCFNVESREELHRLSDMASSLRKTAPVSLRVNPDVDPKTHPYISTGLKENKFGIPWDEARDVYHEAARLPGLAVKGIDCHIGSQLTDAAPVAEAFAKIMELVGQLEAEGIPIAHIDMGGGLGICYADEIPPSVADYLSPILATIGQRQLILEPGRRIVGNAGWLLTRVEYTKPARDPAQGKNFAVVDAAMNDLMRPALYDAWHNVQEVTRGEGQHLQWQIVGPICETGDFLARDRQLALQSGDLLLISSAGAYGMTMSSNYNTRPRAAEVMIDGDQMFPIRERESIADLYRLEHCLPADL